MNRGWAMVMDVSDAVSLQSLRLHAGLAVLEQEDGAQVHAPRVVWLRGSDPEDLQEPALRALPALRRYTIGAGDVLVPLDRLVPDGVLPPGPWARLGEWFTVDAPRAAMAGSLTQRSPLRLVRGGAVTDANLLMVDATAWRAFGEHASALRLRTLAFAMDRRGRVLVRGEPLPPLLGTAYVLDQRIALPAGHAFADPLTHEDVARMLELPAETFALFEPDASWSLLAEHDFVAASRSAIRMNIGTPSDPDASPGHG